MDRSTLSTLKSATIDLLDYCQKKDWAGYDPYDALNSKIFRSLPFLNFRFFRIGFTQFFKRNPINLRSLLLVPKTQNPKAIALFLSSFIKLSKLRLLDEKDLIEKMVENLVTLRSPETSYWCWGYSFPWQTRSLLVPRGAPNLVCTYFVANALLDAYAANRQSDYLTMAVGAAEYVLRELYWTDGGSAAGFAYPLPSSKERVHNANFLGATLLCRAYKHSGEKKFLESALKVARYSAAMQRDDGSWDYGELTTQRWIDNFHTGYNLCALRSIGQYAETSEFEIQIQNGFEFYRDNFFRDNFGPKYFHNQTYPIDIHCVAQSIITLLAFKDLDENNVSLAQSVFKWAMDNMWDEQGYFYYQVLQHHKNRISYMRWSQAWMLYSLTILLENINLD